MAFVKEVNEFTDGYEVYEEITTILANNNKHLLTYVEELADLIITNGIFDISQFNDYPLEFEDVLDRWKLNETFFPLIQEHIEKLKTLRAKLYLSAQKFIDSIQACGMMIKDLGRDIEEMNDFEIRMLQASEEISELEVYADIWQKTRTIITDKSIDDEEEPKIMLKFYKFYEDTSINYFNLCLDKLGKYEGYSFNWPSELVELKQIERLNVCQIEIPANTKITLSKYGNEDVIISALDLKEYC